MTAQDGLTLHVRRYGSRHTSARSVVCLPGLARTASDFHLLATALAADPDNPRLVLALDYRGHGQSQYDRHSNNYTIRVALADLSAVLAALEITSAIFVGTSFGGVLAMILAVLPPIAVAGVILNDIGPVMEPRGLMRIKSYVGKLPIARNFEDGAEILRWLFEAQFTKLAPEDWIAFAKRTCARTTVGWCRPMIRSSPERCAASVWNVSRHYGTSLTRWRASRLWLSAAPIQICWPGRRSMRCWHDAASLKSSSCRIRVTRPCLLSPR